MEPWIGYCHVRAHDDRGMCWIGGRRQAGRWLMLMARSADDFQAGLRRALGPMGYDLIAALSVSPTAYARDLGPLGDDLSGLLPRVNETRPVPLGEFGEIAPGAGWSEIDWDTLWTSQVPLWAVVDGVVWPEISKRLGRGDTEHACLYSTLNPESRALAPWLVRVQPHSTFSAQLQARPQQGGGFVLLSAPTSLDTMRAHLRRFTMLRTPHDPDAAVYFRFYDPRVMIDAVETMPDSFRDGFTSLLDAIIVPVAPDCLVPDGAELTGSPIGVFDRPEDCSGRLLRWTDQTPDATATRRGPAEVTGPEYAALTQRVQRRAEHGLARRLMSDYGHLTSETRCLAIAQGAAAAAAGFDMSSASQVRMIAQVQLLFGADFERRYPETLQFLSERSLLPWQKKDLLSERFTQMTQAHGLANKEIA